MVVPAACMRNCTALIPPKSTAPTTARSGFQVAKMTKATAIHPRPLGVHHPRDFPLEYDRDAAHQGGHNSATKVSISVRNRSAVQSSVSSTAALSGA